MFDYKLLAALAAVVEQGGFERAAQLLGLSQSAVSQRIKLLEARVGQPVLLRAAPPAPTEIGRRLHLTERGVAKAVSRLVKQLGLDSSGDTNVRVRITQAYFQYAGHGVAR